MKKILSVFAAICMSAFLVTTVSAAADYVSNYFKYTVESGSVTIVNYYGRDTEVTVPSVIAGNPVNTIAAGAFSGCTNVKKITLPSTVTDIEEGAFGPGQSVAYQKNSAAGNDSPENKTDQSSSLSSSSVAGDLQENSNQNNEQTVPSQSENTKSPSVNDTTQPSSGVDEQEGTLGSEDDSKQDGFTSENHNSAKKAARNDTRLIVIIVLFVFIVGGVVYLLIRKKRK